MKILKLFGLWWREINCSVALEDAEVRVEQLKRDISRSFVPKTKDDKPQFGTDRCPCFIQAFDYGAARWNPILQDYVVTDSGKVRDMKCDLCDGGGNTRCQWFNARIRYYNAILTQKDYQKELNAIQAQRAALKAELFPRSRKR